MVRKTRRTELRVKCKVDSAFEEDIRRAACRKRWKGHVGRIDRDQWQKIV
jgi:hypothetical protein